MKSFFCAVILFSSVSVFAAVPVRFSVLPAKCTATVQKNGTTKYSGDCPGKDAKITGTVDTPDKATALSERAHAEAATEKSESEKQTK
ncbi:MAG: hypothetical protein EOO48_13560 [Flavobacterium sp.]|nr:MAG: hypothetical protein EOO48_13560 [Flavobacterium sp.]